MSLQLFKIGFRPFAALIAHETKDARLVQLGHRTRYCLERQTKVIGDITTGHRQRNYAGGGYPGNCQLSSYSQCKATASGTYAYCAINPMHAFARHGAQSR